LEEFCKWIIGGETAGIVALALYIRSLWKERQQEYKAELAAARKLLEKDGD
jgi:hypothetical protein